MPTAFNATEAEKEELQWLLTSGALGRSNNLARMLTFICEKRLDGREEEISEYSIAVHALGRRSDFNPHVDTIVRVTAHSLRKRLQEIYQQEEGAHRPVHIVIPAGNYIPSFLPNVSQTAAAFPPPPSQVFSPEKETTLGAKAFLSLWLYAVGAAAVLTIALASLWFAKHGAAWHNAQTTSTAGTTGTGNPVALSANTIPRDDIHALVGTDRNPYVDRSGTMWTPSPFCKGGTSFTSPDQKIAGTEDPTIYLGGIRGVSHCQFPVKPGLYELHLFFAETSDLQEATRYVVYSLNDGNATNLDVVDDAAGDNTATIKVYKGIAPEGDGTIHLDFISEDSMLNAVEILPAQNSEMLPVRIVTSPHAYVDPEKHVWLSDRYYIGGRRGQLPDTAKIADSGLYGSDRIGHFRYIIPVVPQGKYRVKLYFVEPWFGSQNGGSGGVGSRIFDVYCNGTTLLKNFDILGEAGPHSIVKVFDNIQATAQGKIELDFTPIVNYPLINAIEVLPEPAR